MTGVLNLISLVFYSTLLNVCLSQSLKRDNNHDVEDGGGVHIGNSTLASMDEVVDMDLDDVRKLMKTWEVRFNKFSGDPDGFKPLMPYSYPVHGDVYDVLVDMTDAVDVIMVDDERLEGCNVPRLINKLGGLPSYPEEDEEAEFWDVS